MTGFNKTYLYIELHENTFISSEVVTRGLTDRYAWRSSRIIFKLPIANALNNMLFGYFTTLYQPLKLSRLNWNVAGWWWSAENMWETGREKFRQLFRHLCGRTDGYLESIQSCSPGFEPGISRMNIASLLNGFSFRTLCIFSCRTLMISRLMFSASLYSFQPFRARTHIRTHVQTHTHTHRDSYSALVCIGCSQRDEGLKHWRFRFLFSVWFLFPEIPRSMSRLLSFSALFLEIPSTCRFIHFYNFCIFLLSVL